MISIPSDTEALGGSEGREWEGAGQARLCFRGGRGAEQALEREAGESGAGGGLAERLSQAGGAEATKEEYSHREKSV